MPPLKTSQRNLYLHEYTVTVFGRILAKPVVLRVVQIATLPMHSLRPIAYKVQ